jgi:dynein heavy chain
MLILKVFRPEKIIFAVTSYVEARLGRSFVQSPAISMDAIYSDTSKLTPCIFILSSGADPTGILLRFAEEQRYQDRLSIISLGQNQGPKAANLIQKAALNGDWVLLQNCHLAKSWMPSLEKIVLDFPSFASSIHDDFRLFLTSSPALYFPVPVLQLSVKLTNEPPKGLRANILRTYGTIVTPAVMSSCSKPDQWKRMIFSLAFFHAAVQERRKFGPLGWNIRYDFNDSDLETSIEVLRNFLDEQAVIPWDALRYVTGEINYGGRVTDDWDRRTIMSMLNKFYQPGILEENYKFSESGKYFIPPVTEHIGFVEYINDLPATEEPEIYGMHANANILFQIQESNNLLNTILSLQPRIAGSSSGKSPDEVVNDLAMEIEKLVPLNLDMEEAGPSTFIVKENGLLDSLATVNYEIVHSYNSHIK